MSINPRWYHPQNATDGKSEWIAGFGTSERPDDFGMTKKRN